MLQIEIQISKAPAFPFSAPWVDSSRLPYASQPSNNRAALGIVQQVILNPSQHMIRRATSQSAQPPRKGTRFSKYHTVRYTTLWDTLSRGQITGKEGTPPHQTKRELGKEEIGRRGDWGERRDSNPRHPEPQSGALPTELRSPQDKGTAGSDYYSKMQFVRSALQTTLILFSTHVNSMSTRGKLAGNETGWVKFS